jgi:hypothetical protein
MAYNDPYHRDIRKQYETRRLRQLIVIVPVIPMILAFATANEETKAVLGFIPIHIYTPILFVVLVAALVFSVVNWRCPACNTYLGKRADPKFCDKCGVRLKD